MPNPFALTAIILPSATYLTTNVLKLDRSLLSTRITTFLGAWLLPALLLHQQMMHVPILTFLSVDYIASFLSQWIHFFPSAPTYLRSGPLGPGGYKILQTTVALGCWRLVDDDLFDYFSMQGWLEFPQQQHIRSWTALLLVVAFHVGVGVVLYGWSRWTTRWGDAHAGVRDYVQPTLGRRLRPYEYVEIGILALLNATCEEIWSRGVVRATLERTAGLSASAANAYQAVLFGSWHYAGVPSGWSGVVLTSVYGWVMGVLADWYGCGVPMLAHGAVDCFIFAYIARMHDRK